MEPTGFLDGIKEMIERTTGLTGDFIDSVDLRLRSLGYSVQESDAWMIAFIIQKVANTIKNICNISVVPKSLKQVAIDMICGEFLLNKKNTGQLDGFEIDVDSPALKQTQSGDTNVVFALEGMKTPEQRLDAVINYLMTYGLNQLIGFRRIKWT
jgi:hypothetical protein